MEKKIKVAISLGDPSGIGIEVVLKTLESKEILDFFTPILFGSTKILSHYKNLLGLERINFQGIPNPQANIEGKINVVNCWKENIDFPIGVSNKDSGKFALASLKAAAQSVLDGHADILVTAPINKENIQSEEFHFPGHTEFLGDFWKGEPLMFMISELLRVGLVSQHIPIKDVASQINKENIQQKIKDLNQSLKLDFGIDRPKIAVLALNPHAGDNGLLGNEELEIINPAIKELFDEGILAFGAYPADSFFNPNQLNEFDGILAMYHDQGLIPFKTLAFDDGINFTAGLPFVRTSPDHGVAYDIAGKGIANEESFKYAIFEGIKIFQNRLEFEELTKNPLKHKVLKLERGENG